MNSEIIIRANGSTKSGLGHLYRGLAISECIPKGIDFTFVTNYNKINTISNSEINVVDDQFGCPTYAKDLANDILKIIKLNSSFNFENKIFNYSNLSYTNWYDFAQTIKSICGFNNLINPVSTGFYKNDVKRPKFSVTSKQKIIDTFNLEINNWDISLEDYLKNDLG